MAYRIIRSSGVKCAGFQMERNLSCKTIKSSVGLMNSEGQEEVTLLYSSHTLK